jgi:hypothetical protein
MHPSPRAADLRGAGADGIAGFPDYADEPLPSSYAPKRFRSYPGGNFSDTGGRSAGRRFSHLLKSLS